MASHRVRSSAWKPKGVSVLQAAQHHETLRCCQTTSRLHAKALDHLVVHRCSLSMRTTCMMCLRRFCSTSACALQVLRKCIGISWSSSASLLSQFSCYSPDCGPDCCIGDIRLMLCLACFEYVSWLSEFLYCLKGVLYGQSVKNASQT